MAAFRFRQRQTRRWWYAGATLVAVAFFTVFFVSGAFAVISGPPISPSHFEAGDGNMTNDVANNSDWNCFAGHDNFAQTGITAGATCNGNLVYANAAQVTADQVTTTGCTTAPCEISWVNGQKFDTACPALAVNNNPPKDEFTHVASYNETDPSTKDLFFYGATIRPNTNGNSTGNVEFDQKAGNGTTTAGCRTAGDRLIAYDFLNGGTSLNFHVITWITNQIPGVTDTLGGNTGSGACFVKTDTDAFNSTTGTGGCWGANVITESNNDLSTFEGGVNTGLNGVTGAIDAAHNAISGGTGGDSVPALAFAEFGINVSKAFGTSGQCTSFAQVQWESRSSGSSFTSNPQDIETEGKTVSNCGSITIVKHTDPRNLNQNFSYTASGGSISPTSFKLNDRSGLAISGISAANPAVVTTAASGFTAGDKVGVTITGSNSTPSANGNWTATVIDSTHFSIPLAVTTAGTAGSVTFNTEVYGTLFAGTTYTFNEPSVSGFSLESLTCANNGGTADATVVSGSTATIPLVAGDNWVCTYVNKPNSATLSTSASKTGTVTPGTAVNDTATVDGSTSTVPTGTNVTFYLCGPSSTALTSCTTGTSIGVGSALTATGTTGEASSTSSNVNCAADGTGCAAGENPLTAGYYCFRAVWGGDSAYPNGASSTSITGECFQVSQIPTSRSLPTIPATPDSP